MEDGATIILFKEKTADLFFFGILDLNVLVVIMYVQVQRLRFLFIFLFFYLMMFQYIFIFSNLCCSVKGTNA